MPHASSDENKAIYTNLHDHIREKRFESEHRIRRYAHRHQYQMVVDAVPAGSTVFDAGCGEGMLSVMLAKKGCTVTGMDISIPNIESCKRYAEEEGVSDRTTFLVGDLEHVPLPDKSFQYVVSSHVLEHLPDFQQGVREIARLATTRAVVAIPTCLNASAMVLLGGDKYWAISRRTLYALPYGMLRVLWALITGREGVDEGYVSREELVHIWRFPWRGKWRLERDGLTVEKFAASSYISPYIPWLLPLAKALSFTAYWPILRNFGYGTTYVCIPQDAASSSRSKNHSEQSA